MNEEWKTIEHALNYLSKADRIPHRAEGESALLEEISSQSRRILDIGAGDGRLLLEMERTCSANWYQKIISIHKKRNEKYDSI